MEYLIEMMILYFCLRVSEMCKNMQKWKRREVRDLKKKFDVAPGRVKLAVHQQRAHGTRKNNDWS